MAGLLAIGLLLAAVLAAAGTLWLARSLKAPDIKLVSIRPERIGPGQQTLRVDLRIRSPNRFALPVRAMTYRLWLEDREIASGESVLKRRIAALAEETVEVLVSGDARHLAHALPALALKRQPWRYRIAGTLTPAARVRVRYQHEGHIDAKGVLRLAASLR